MALPASDDFAGSGALSASWTVLDGSTTRVSDQADAAGVGANGSLWNADTFNDDQYAEVTIGSTTPNCGPATRLTVSGATGTGYVVTATGANITLYRWNGNESYTSIAALGGSVTTGDVVRLESEGTTHRVYKNGTQVGSDQTNATYTTGSAGMFLYDATATLNAWEGGNLAAGGGGGSVKRLTLLGVG